MLETLHINNREISLPSFMTSLPKEVVNYLVSLEDSSSRIMAAGVDKKDHSLVFLTGAGDVRYIKPNGKSLPVSGRPSYDGRHVFVTFQGSSDVFPIDSSLAIKTSESCMTGASLTVNDILIGDLDIQSI